MDWMIVIIMLFVIALAFCTIILELPTSTALIVAAVIVVGILLLVMLVQLARFLLSQPPGESGRRRWEEPEAPDPMRRQRLELVRLELVIRGPDGKHRLGRMVNPGVDTAVRPYVEFVLNDARFVGKTLPITFEILGPRGGLKYTQDLQVPLVLGTNRAYPRGYAFAIKSQMSRGKRGLRVWVGEHPWEEVTFVLSDASPDAIEEIGITSDMEATSAEMDAADELSGAVSIDDLLNE